MSTNLVSDITQILNPYFASRAASSLGLDGAQVENALHAGAPGLLAALSSLVSKRSGAAALNAAVAQQPTDFLSSLASAVGTSGQKSLIDTGVSTLSSLIGSSTLTALVNAVGRYAGIGGEGSKSLMGLLAPVVLGVLGQQQRENGLDASGLAKLVASQKDNILRAMPSGFSELLGNTGLLDGMPDATHDVHSASPASRRREHQDYTTVPPPKAAASSHLGWLLPALALAAFGLAWYLFPSPAPTDTAEAPPPAKVESPITTGAIPDRNLADFASLESLRGIKAGEVDVGARVADAVTKLRASLEGVTDEASAMSAATPIKQSADELDSVGGLLGQLSPENKASLARALAAVRPAIDRLIDKALLVPGATAILKPSIDSIRSEIDSLVTA